MPSQLLDGRTTLESQAMESASAMADTKPSLSQPEPIERSKLVSPAPIEASSLTPPPSSQVPGVKNGSSTPNPAANFPVSPPPTTQVPDSLVAPSAPFEPPTTDQINTASMEDLRNMVSKLTLALNEARTTAAHHKLQYTMLQIESNESQNRMAVELEMAQREVDVLQAADERRKQEYMSPAQTAADVNNAHVLLNEMTAYSAKLQSENDQLREVVASLDNQLLYRAGEIEDKNAEIKRLRDRIRQNREHMTGFLDNLNENTSPSVFSTPRRTPHHGTPRHAASSRVNPPAVKDNPGLEAILLADKVLSQTLNSQTSSQSQPKPRGHTRGTQSLSSLPSTPTRPSTIRSTAPNTLRTPPQSLAAILEPPMPATQPIPTAVRPPPFSLATGPGAQQYAQQQQQTPPPPPRRRRRRRGSSDSTITASSVDGEDGNEGGGGSDDEIPESQASQAATSMLRATPVEKGGSARSSFNSINSGHHSSGHGSGGGNLVQTKLGVTKVGKGVGVDISPEKRRLASYGSDPALMGSPVKKARVASAATTEGVGLGIAGMMPRARTPPSAKRRGRRVSTSGEYFKLPYPMDAKKRIAEEKKKAKEEEKARVKKEKEEWKEQVRKNKEMEREAKKQLKLEEMEMRREARREKKVKARKEKEAEKQAKREEERNLTKEKTEVRLREEGQE